jgi:acetyl-CoA synthetase
MAGPRRPPSRSIFAAIGQARRLAATYPEDLAFLHFTSDTTGRPKGAMHVHAAALAHHITGRYALDLQSASRDVLWCLSNRSVR